MWFIRILAVFLMFHMTSGKELYKVGIIHDHCSTWIEFNISYVFKYPNDHSEIVYECINYPKGESYFEEISQTFIIINSTKISALIGPFNEAFALGCETARIPYIVTSMVPFGWPESSFLLRLVPDVVVYAKAIEDMLKYLKWKKIGVLYDRPQVPHVISDIVDKHTSFINAYHIESNATEQEVRTLLKELRENYFEDFLLMCSSSIANIVLTQALYLNMLSRPHAWLVVNLDWDEVALEQYEDSRANLTSMLIVLEKNPDRCALQTNNLTDAIFYDAMAVITQLIDLNKNSTKVQMRKNLRQIKHDGCTGLLEFNKVGLRKESFFEMRTLSTTMNGSSHLFQSGTWRSGKLTLTDRLMPSKSYTAMMKKSDIVYGGKTLIVTTIIEPPFIQWKNKTPIVNFTGDFNDNLEGFCISIMEEIAKMQKFKYNLTLVPDGKFGSLKKKGWTGMVKVLFEKKADIALAPFQVTPERSEAVDFTKPFMIKGTSVVVRKPERSISPFQFLMPLSKFVWISIFVAFVVTAITLFFTSRINCDREHRRMDNIRESFWYIWGTLLRGNLQVAPRGISSRIISCVWWFFSLIVISIYTANLAAFLTISNAHIPIQSASDLADQNIYEYGTVNGSQLESFFRKTEIRYYEKMWAVMKLSGLVRRVEDGFERVMNSQYAFLWDSPTVRHETAKNCKLVEIGNPFDLKGYGIATQKGSPLSELLSHSILKLEDKGILYRLEGKWWRRPNCPDPRQSAKSREIAIQVASGMFIVLLAGIGLAILVFVLELIYFKYFSKRRKKSVEEREENNIPVVNSQNSNHVTQAAETKEDIIRCRLARTLSIGESSSLHSKWESYDQL